MCRVVYSSQSGRVTNIEKLIFINESTLYFIVIVNFC